MDPEEIDLSDVSDSELSSEWDSSDDDIVESLDDLTVALQNAGISVENEINNEKQFNSIESIDKNTAESFNIPFEVEENDEDAKPLTKHEILPDQIDIESIDITLPDKATFARAGKIIQLLPDCIIIDAGKESQPIEENACIFNEEHQCVGRIFEIFGQITEPMYIIRWPKDKQLDISTLHLNDWLFYCDNITHFLIPSTLKCPATDASNFYDEEPTESERKTIECTEDINGKDDEDIENGEYPRQLMIPNVLVPKHKVEMVLHPDYSIYKNCVIPSSPANTKTTKHQRNNNKQSTKDKNNFINQNTNSLSSQNNQNITLENTNTISPMMNMQNTMNLNQDMNAMYTMNSMYYNDPNYYASYNQIPMQNTYQTSSLAELLGNTYTQPNNQYISQPQSFQYNILPTVSINTTIPEESHNDITTETKKPKSADTSYLQKLTSYMSDDE